jgi:hypothetical protein
MMLMMTVPVSDVVLSSLNASMGRHNSWHSPDKTMSRKARRVVKRIYKELMFTVSQEIRYIHSIAEMDYEAWLSSQFKEGIPRPTLIEKWGNNI